MPIGVLSVEGPLGSDLWAEICFSEKLESKIFREKEIFAAYGNFVVRVISFVKLSICF